MDARPLLLVVVALLGGGYLVYGRLVARVVGVDPSRPTPAHTRYDGVDFVPAPQWLVLFGHHFSSICAAGPIVGPALAVAYWGWAPSLAWIVLGGVLMGAVADFTSLMVAVRHGGVSIAEVSGRLITRRARTLFSVFILITLILVLAVFAVLTAGTFVQASEIVVPSWGILPVAALAGFFLYRGRAGGRRLALVTVLGLGAIVGLLALGHAFPPPVPGVAGLDPQTLWILVLLAYCFVASILPVQYLLQPRDYLSSYVLFTTIGLGLVGVFVTGPSFEASPFHGFQPVDLAPGRTAVAPHVRHHRLWRDLGLPLRRVLGHHVQAARHRGPRLPHRVRGDDPGVHGGHAGGDRRGAGLTATRHAELLRAPAGPSPAFGEGTAPSPGPSSGPTAPPSPSWPSTSSS